MTDGAKDLPTDRDPMRRTTAGEAWPPPRRSRALAVTLLAMLAIGAAAGAYMLRHRPWRAETTDAALSAICHGPDPAPLTACPP